MARSPEFLDAVIAGAPKGTRVTQDYVEDIRRRQADIESRAREEAALNAELERKEAEKREAEARAKAKAATKKEEKQEAQAELERAKSDTEAAKEKERETRTAPKKKTEPPAPADVPLMAIQARFIADAAEATILARASAKRIKESKDELTAKGAAALTEAALEAANAWTEAAQIVRSELATPSGHLSVVEQ